MVGEVQRDAAIALAERLDADPDDLAGRGDGIKIRGIQPIDARRENLGLENRRRERGALELFDGIEQRIRAVPALDDPLPGGAEPAEHGLVDRFDLVAQLRERSAA